MVLAIVLLSLAGLIGLAAWIWLVVMAFQRGDKLWGILMSVGFVLPFGPLFPIIFAIRHWAEIQPAGLAFMAALGIAIMGGLLMFALVKEAAENAAQAAAVAAAPPTFEDGDPAAAAARASRGKRNARPRDAAAPAAESPVEPTAPPAPTGPEAERPPVQVTVVRLGEPGTSQMRSLRLRIANADARAVQEIKLDLAYLDARGQKLGGWKTVHSDAGVLAAPQSTNEVELSAFFVPQFATSARVNLEAVRFSDGSRWPKTP